MVPQNVRREMSAKEFADRRYADKAINAMINYGKSKLAGYPFDAWVERCGDVWRIVITVEYVPQPPPLKIIPNKETSIR
jgi:hypothetical protein